MKSDIDKTVQPAVLEALRDGVFTHVVVLVTLPDGDFTWSSDEAMTVGDARELMGRMMALLNRPRRSLRCRGTTRIF